MNPSLGDEFPNELREKSAKRNIKQGVVLRCEVGWFRDKSNRIKRFVIIGVSEESEEVGCLCINSNINEDCIPERLRKYHHKLEEQGREYLDHNSYINCSEIYTKNYNELKNKLAAEPEVKIGEMSEEDKIDIISIVRNAITITKRDLEKFDI